MKPHNFLHGETKTRLYRIWHHMRMRCINEKYHAYGNYGSRGIAVCEEWNSFLTFKTWALSNGYSDSLTIDRIDNDGNYSPENCRWVTRKVQNRNTRVNVVIDGELLVDISQRTGIKYTTLYRRVQAGWELNKILSPVGGSTNVI